MRYVLFLGVLLALLLTGCAAVFSPQEPAGEVTVPLDSNFEVKVVAEDLDIPWEVAFLPSGDLLVTQRPGTLLRIGQDQRQFPIAGVHHVGEGGLLGLALHPDFSENRLLYLYLTTQRDGVISNRVQRYVFEDDMLSEMQLIISDIPGARYHDGGRLAFGPQGYLFITTGDAGDGQAAQDTSSLAGKILRLHADGSIPDDNPFGNAVYSYGHRNPQGLTWDGQGRLWSTEHGRSGVRSGFDELNLIEAGGNYGWPIIQGDETRLGMIAPVAHSGPEYTWAPASAQYLNGSVFFAGLRGESLYEAMLASDGIVVREVVAHLYGEYGRLRTVRLGPDGDLYVMTSNTDGRGTPERVDDRLLRFDPLSLKN